MGMAYSFFAFKICLVTKVDTILRGKKMKKLTRRTISLLLAVMLLFCCSACGSDDGSGSSGGKLEVITEGTEGLVFKTYYNGSECFVSDYTGTEENIVIPTVYKGIPVAGIGEDAFHAFHVDVEIKSVYIPNTITWIGDSAFYGAEITEIGIPASVTSIDDQAFMDCTKLQSIQIPSSVTSLGRKAFGKCTSLKEITIPASVTQVDDECFYKCENLTDIYCEAPMEPSTWSTYWTEDMPATVQIHWDCK